MKPSTINTPLDTDDLCTDPLKLLWYGRLHPSLDPLWSTILSPINILLCLLFVALALEGVLLSHKEDIFFTAECLQTCFLMTHAIGIILTLRLHRASLLQLLNNKLKFWNIKDFTGEVYKECRSISINVKKIFRYYYCLNTFVCVFFDLQPVTTGYLPTGCYVPSGSFKYLTVILWYLSCVVLMALPGTDSFFCSLATSLIIQFKLLNHKFKNLDLSKYDSKTKSWNELKHLVNYHTFLLRFSKKLNATFQGIFLLQFLLAIASGAISVFIFTQPGAWINRIKFLLFFVATTIESAFYCVPLEFLVNTANEVGNSVYKSEWYQIKDIQLRKSFSLVVMRSQKVIVFSAYGLVWINLQTFVVICKTVFSFYTYLSSARKINT